MWNRDMDSVLLYTREVLQCSFADCCYYLNREFGNKRYFSRNAAIGRYNRLKYNGVMYKKQKGE